MSDLEYTMRLIHEEASKLARLTAEPQVGMMSYLEAVWASMARLQALRMVQKAPAL